MDSHKLVKHAGLVTEDGAPPSGQHFGLLTETSCSLVIALKSFSDIYSHWQILTTAIGDAHDTLVAPPPGQHFYWTCEMPNRQTDRQAEPISTQACIQACSTYAL